MTCLPLLSVYLVVIVVEIWNQSRGSHTNTRALISRPFSRLAAFTALLRLVWQLTQMSFPFIFPPLFVFPSVFSSHLLLEPQLQGSVFLPSICLVTCAQTNEPAPSRVPPARLCH